MTPRVGLDGYVEDTMLPLPGFEPPDRPARIEPLYRLHVALELRFRLLPPGGRNYSCLL